MDYFLMEKVIENLSNSLFSLADITDTT